MSKKKPLGFVSVDHTEGESAVTIRLNRVPTKSEFGLLTKAQPANHAWYVWDANHVGETLFRTLDKHNDPAQRTMI